MISYQERGLTPSGGSGPAGEAMNLKKICSIIHKFWIGNDRWRTLGSPAGREAPDGVRPLSCFRLPKNLFSNLAFYSRNWKKHTKKCLPFLGHCTAKVILVWKIASEIDEHAFAIGGSKSGRLEWTTFELASIICLCSLSELTWPLPCLLG